jgi:hypothetical protein
MNVALVIGMAVMFAMLGCPPENALLRRRLCQRRHNELGETAHFVASMTEIAVISGGHGKHTQAVCGGYPNEQTQRERDEEHAQCRKMQESKSKNSAKPVLTSEACFYGHIVILGPNSAYVKYLSWTTA